jgi:membrane protein implicated in regulation of membrane protease activity
MGWWLWVLLGIGLLAVEMATPGGFFALFFGLGAILVGILTALGWSGPAWMQWVLFSALSVAALLLLRGPLKGRLSLRGSQRPVDSLVGESAMVIEDVPTSGVGKVDLRGSSWSARSAAALAKGQRCIVDRVDGLTLWVRPE